MNRPTALFAALLACAAAGPAAAQIGSPVPANHRFDVTLTGAQEVPPVTAPGSSTMVIEFDPGLTSATFTGTVTGANPVTAAHLHCAPAGVNGGVVAPLFTTATPEESTAQGGGTVGGGAGTAPGGSTTATLSGTITNADITPPTGEDADNCGATITNVASLYAAVRAGLIYANVHTTVNPQGEMRGQLFPGQCPALVLPMPGGGFIPPGFGSTPPGQGQSQGGSNPQGNNPGNGS